MSPNARPAILNGIRTALGGHFGDREAAYAALERNYTHSGRLDGSARLALLIERLREYDATSQRFSTIVLDPPAFAKSKRAAEGAARGYKELNLRAMKMLRPGGILVTCSCSFHVSTQDFLKVLADAAQDAHKSMRIIEHRGAAKDHPVLLNVPETRYLQCIILSVTD